MTKLRNSKKIMITVKVMIILSLLFSSLLFIGRKSPTVHAEGGSTEMTNRVLRKYPSEDTATKIGAYYQSRTNPATYEANNPPALTPNPDGLFVIPQQTLIPGKNNNANYWSQNKILAEKGQSASGMVRTKDPINLLDEDMEFTFCNQLDRYINTDSGFAFFFTSDLDFVSTTGSTVHSDSGTTYGALGLYSRYGIDGTDADKMAEIAGMKNALAVEFDCRNQNDETGPDTRRIDGLTADQHGNSIPFGDRGDHVAITFPQESQYIFNQRTDNLLDGTPIPTNYPPRNSQNGFFLPHHAVSAKKDFIAYGGGMGLSKISTATITWKLKDGGATNSYLDNVYELSYKYYAGSETEDVSAPTESKLVGSGSLEIPFWITPTPTNPWPNDFYHTFLYDKDAKDIWKGYDRRPNNGGQTAPDPMAPTQMPTDSEVAALIAANPIKMGITAATGTGGPSRSKQIFYFPDQQLNYTVNYYIEGTTTKVPDLVLSTTDTNPYNNSNPYIGSAVLNTKLRIIPPISPTYDLVPNQDLTPTITTEGQVINIYYKAKTLDYTIEYYNNGVKMEPSSTDTLPRSGSVPSTNPNVTSVPITNCPEGSAVASYEFPAGTKVGPPSAANPYKITTIDNVIKVNYKSSIIENPNEDQINDPDYLILNFDANDLNNGLANEEIRGRLTSKTNSAIKDQETIKYAVLKGTPWSKVVEKAAVPKLEIQSGNWLFKAPTTGYNKNQWTTQRTGGTNIPEQNSTTKIDDLYQNGTRELTYYAQFTQNTPVGIKDKINSIIALALASSLLFLTYFYLIIRKKKDTIR